MQHVSRREAREDRIIFLAEQGLFSTEFNLFKSENRKMVKDGFQTTVFSENKKKAVPTLVSWENAFSGDPPPVVLSYIEGKTNTFPEFDTWAQKLYIIAARAQHDKGTN